MAYLALFVVALVAVALAVVALCFLGVVYLLTRPALMASNPTQRRAAEDGRRVSLVPPSNSNSP